MRALRNLILTLLGLAAIAGSQVAYDHSALGYKAIQKVRVTTFPDPLVPTEPALELLSLGDRPLVADILWLSTIQYFGSGNPYGKYAALAPMMDRVTRLDPKFEYPVEFSLIVLPYMDGTQTALQIGERAQANIPNDGLLTYYLASVYHLDAKDYKKAAFYYEKASHQPGAPAASKDLAGVALARVDDTLSDRLVALTFWQTVYANAKNADDQARAKGWIVEIQALYDIEKAASAYHDQHGAYPPDIKTLQNAGLLGELPPPRVDFEGYTLDPTTGKASYGVISR